MAPRADRTPLGSDSPAATKRGLVESHVYSPYGERREQGMLLRHDEAKMSLRFRRREPDGYEPSERGPVYVLRYDSGTDEVVLTKDGEDVVRDAVR